MLKQPYQPFEWIEMDKNGQVVKLHNIFSLEGVKFKNKPPEPPRRTPEQVAQDVAILYQPRKSLDEEYREIKQKNYENKNWKNKGGNRPYYENKNWKNKGGNRPHYKNNKNRGKRRNPWVSRWKRPFNMRNRSYYRFPRKVWKKIINFKHFDANALATSILGLELIRRERMNSSYKRIYLKKTGLVLLPSKLFFSWSRSVFQKLIFIFLLDLLNIGHKKYTRKFLFLQIIKVETLLGYYSRIQFHLVNTGGFHNAQRKNYSFFPLKRRLKKKALLSLRKSGIKQSAKRGYSNLKKKKLFKLKIIPHATIKLLLKKKRYWWGNPGFVRLWDSSIGLKRLRLVHPGVNKVFRRMKFLKRGRQDFSLEVLVGSFIYNCHKRHGKWKATPFFLAFKDWKKFTRYDMRAKKIANRIVLKYQKSIVFKKFLRLNKARWSKKKIAKLKKVTKRSKGRLQKKVLTRLKIYRRNKNNKVKFKKVRKFRRDIPKCEKRQKRRHKRDVRYIFQLHGFKYKDFILASLNKRKKEVERWKKVFDYRKRIFLKGQQTTRKVVFPDFRNKPGRWAPLFQSRKEKFKSMYKTSWLFRPGKWKYSKVWRLSGLPIVQRLTPFIQHERKMRKIFFRRFPGRKNWLHQKNWVINKLTRLRPKLNLARLGGLLKISVSLSLIKKIAGIIKTSLLRYVFLFWLTFLIFREAPTLDSSYKPFIVKNLGFNVIINQSQRDLSNFSDLLKEDKVFLIPSLSRLGELLKNNFLGREKLGVKSRRLKYIKAQGLKKKRRYRMKVSGKGVVLPGLISGTIKYFWFTEVRYRKTQKNPALQKRFWFAKAVGRQLKKKRQKQLQLFFPKSKARRKVSLRLENTRYIRFAENFLIFRGQLKDRLHFYITRLRPKMINCLKRRTFAKKLVNVRLSSDIKPGKKKTLNNVLLGREQARGLSKKVEVAFRGPNSLGIKWANVVKLKFTKRYRDVQLLKKENAIGISAVRVNIVKNWRSVPLIKIFWLLILSQYLIQNWQKVFIKYFLLKEKKTTQVQTAGTIISYPFRGKGWQRNRFLRRKYRTYWCYNGGQDFNSEAQKKVNWKNRNYSRKIRGHDFYIKQLTTELYVTKLFNPWASKTRLFINNKQLKINFFLSLFNILKRKKIFDSQSAYIVKSTVRFKLKGWKKHKHSKKYLTQVSREKGILDPIYYVKKYLKWLKRILGLSYNIKKRPLIFQTLIFSVICKCLISRQLLSNFFKAKLSFTKKKNKLVKNRRIIIKIRKLLRVWRRKKRLKRLPRADRSRNLYKRIERRVESSKYERAEKNKRDIKAWWHYCRYMYTQYAYWYLSQQKPFDKVAWTISKFRRNVSGLFRNYPTRVSAIIPFLAQESANGDEEDEEGLLGNILVAEENGSEKLKVTLIKKVRPYLRYSAVPWDNLFIFRRKRRSLIKIRYLFKQLFLWIYQQNSTKFKLGSEIRRSLFKNFFFKNLFILKKNFRRY